MGMQGGCAGVDLPRRADAYSFTRNLLNTPLLDKQAEWCEVFDRGRTTSLLLFEHVHAESRDRGRAMVDLLAGMKGRSATEL